VHKVITAYLNYAWRLVATGVCFAAFGLGGILLLIIFSVLRFGIRHPQRRIRQGKAVIHFMFQCFIGLMHGLGVLRFEIIGRERLKRTGLLILANHPSLIDTVFLIALVRRADCIVKAGLRTNLFTRGPVNAAGYICNDHGDELINDCITSLRSVNNLIVFPEGTRTPPSGHIELKRGAAHIALRAQSDITPVVITCQPKTLGKHEKWWKIPPYTVRFRIEVQEDIQINQFISARHLTTYLQTYFSERSERYA
jgi:1-acyl-sn-glycerol-3-phosphate acyltransferase